MEARDLIVTPILVLITFVVALVIRPYFTNSITRKYFLPALFAKIAGALAVGFIYQFYYNGGDTFSYHTHGSRIIWNAFFDNPEHGIQLLLANGTDWDLLPIYTWKIWYYGDPQSYFIIRIAALFDLLTFSSYSGTSVLFSLLAFTGGWLLFNTFYQMYPTLHRWIAFSTLFFPSVVFWGSGIFKDTITLAALGFCIYSVHQIFMLNRYRWTNFLILIVSFYVIFSVKKYILICFFPGMIVWTFASRFSSIRPAMLRFALLPFVAFLILYLALLGTLKITQDDPRYNVERIAMTAKITAYDIRYGWGARTGEGSGYTLGELDGGWESMLRLAPKAINVTLFRPYLWEVKSPLMLLSAIESFAILIMTIAVLIKVRFMFFKMLIKPDILFCITFAIIFAFAVGVSTFNFGTLSRYKIPLMPFYCLGIGLIHFYWKRDRKMERLEEVEY